ncbi:MAG: tetratricopeptide repeat protein [Flavihumibacter sp.]|nr:tetratricopeptide repeat protein [Flavihumibacter sp.]
MKSWFARLLLGVWAVSAACNNSNTEKEEVATILTHPPYQNITDSINEDPDNTALYQRRAALLLQQDELQLAQADLTKAWELQPSEASAEQLVNVLFMLGNNREAIRFLEELIKKYPENTGFQRRLSEALVNNGATNEAILAYNNLIAEDSANFEAWYERGLLYLEQTDTAAAIRDLENSYKLQPLLLTGLTLANIYAEKKNERALLLADQAIARDSLGEMADPYFIKGVYYVNTGNKTKALDLFNNCIRINWKFQEAYVEKGIIYYEAKNLDEALQQFKLAATVTNTYPEAYYWQGRCYEALGMKQEALLNYGRAYSLDKTFKEAIEGAERVEGKE